MLFLTFEGTREAKVRDRDTRIRIALAGVQAARLWRLLGAQRSDVERRATQ
jgi:CII-binding regulator of phage lambda lysogenization HflD